MDFITAEKEIKGSFYDESGPGDLPLTLRNNNISGVIVPTMNYPVMAWGYKEIAEAKFPKTYIVLIPGYVNGVILNGFQASFGHVDSDIGLGTDLMNKFGLVKVNFNAIDFSFLQFVSKQYLHSLRVLTLMINKFSYELAEHLSQLNDVSFIVVSDLNKSENKVYKAEDSVRGLDQFLLKFILGMDEKGLVNFSEKKMIGAGIPIALMIEIARLKFTKSSLLFHDVTTTENYCVGNASFVFKGK